MNGIYEKLMMLQYSICTNTKDPHKQMMLKKTGGRLIQTMENKPQKLTGRNFACKSTPQIRCKKRYYILSSTAANIAAVI